MKNKWTRLLLVGIAMFSLTLSACGGGGGSDDGNELGGSRVTTGQFKNTYVEGLKYKCISDYTADGWDYDNPSKIDYTDKDGTYSCLSRGFIEFYIGDFLLGSSMELKSLITPYDLSSLNFPDHLPELKVQLISQTLQSIDEDNNLSNGIKIAQNFDYLDDFHIFLKEYTQAGYEDALEQAIKRGGYTLIDGETALANLNNSLNMDWASYLSGEVILYSVFKEKEETTYQHIKIELKNDGVALATYESDTQTGSYEILDEKILFIGNFPSFPPSYYRLQADDGNRLNVCLVDENTEEEWRYCEREYLYYNLDDVTNDIKSGRLQ